MVDGEETGRADRTAGFHVEEGESLTVTAEVGVHHADVIFFRTLYQYGSGTVAKEGASLPVLVVGYRRHLVGTDDNDSLHPAALNHHGSMVERKEESATSSPEVKCVGILQPELSQHDAGCRRELIIGGRGGNDDRINGIRVNVCFTYQLLGGLPCHVTGSETLFAEDAAFLDADTRRNPLVIGIYHARQFLVGEDIVWHVTSNTRDYRVDSAHYSATSSSFLIATLPR